jgi:hypothetical protein
MSEKSLDTRILRSQHKYGTATGCIKSVDFKKSEISQDFRAMMSYSATLKTVPIEI